MGVFDDILNEIPEADRAVLDKYPKLKSTVEELDDHVSRWETWRRNNFDDKARMTKTEASARRELEMAQMRISDLEAGAGADMNFDEILDGLKQKGIRPSEEIERELAAKFVDPKKLDDLSAGFEFLYTKTATMPFKHFREFNEDLDMKGLFKYMNENRIMDPEDAYSKMVAPKRQSIAAEAEKARAEETAAKIEAARKEGAEAARKDMAMSGSRVPTDSSGASPAFGHLQQSQFRRGKPVEDAAKLDEYKLGDGKATQLGYEELLTKRSEQTQ